MYYGNTISIEDKHQNDHRIPGLRYRSIRATNSKVALRSASVLREQISIEDKHQNDHRIPGLRYRSIRATNSKVARKER